jgi:Fe2+ or Zn2+ uptake regulation protein
MAAPRKANKVYLSGDELRLLEAINEVGPCSSDSLHEHLKLKFELLFVMRSLHTLAEKGFLQRIVINNKQLYRTARNYDYIRSYIRSADV